MPDHVCHQKEIIAEHRAGIAALIQRLGCGDVTLATIDLRLAQILEQTTKTNGRVTKLEDASRKPRMNAAAATAVIGCCVVICTSLVSLVNNFVTAHHFAPPAEDRPK